MKKIFMMMALVAMTLTVSAQGLKTFDGKLFSCQYPANFVAQEQWMEIGKSTRLNSSHL